MYDIITVGSATVDVFAKTEKSELIKIFTQSSEQDLLAYPVGSKILIDELEFMTGGGGSNTAVAFARLGLKTAFLNTLGKDENSKRVLNELKQEKVSFLGNYSNKMTNYSIVLDSIEHDRTILVYKGASSDFRFNNINKAKLTTKWFYFCSMAETFKELESIAQFAQRHNIKMAFNPSEYLVQKGKKYLSKVLSKIDVLVFNKEEAQLLLKTQEHDMRTLLNSVRELGPKIVVITDGKHGAYCSDGITFYTVLPKKVKVIETTGAGDAFAATFVSGLIKKKDIEFALKLAQANAESVIQHYGAKNILLRWNAAVLAVKRNRYRVIKKRMEGSKENGH